MEQRKAGFLGVNHPSHMSVGPWTSKRCGEGQVQLSRVSVAVKQALGKGEMIRQCKQWHKVLQITGRAFSHLQTGPNPKNFIQAI